MRLKFELLFDEEKNLCFVLARLMMSEIDWIKKTYELEEAFDPLLKRLQQDGYPIVTETKKDLETQKVLVTMTYTLPKTLIWFLLEKYKSDERVNCESLMNFVYPSSNVGSSFYLYHKEKK